jgi:hypothetical protein
MARRKVQATVAIAFLISPLVFLAAACSGGDEERFIMQFFRAARARDNTTLALMSAVSFSPREQGTVEDFEVTNVSEETRRPLEFKSLIEAERKVTEERQEFTKKKLEYQNANIGDINAVVKLERDPKAKMTPAQLKVKAEWDKWRADTSTLEKAYTSARTARADAIGPAEASLTQPGQSAFNAEQFEGELISKDVTVDAQVRSPEGQTSQKTLVITMQRVTGTLNGEARDGRWIITRIQGA